MPESLRQVILTKRQRCMLKSITKINCKLFIKVHKFTLLKYVQRDLETATEMTPGWWLLSIDVHKNVNKFYDLSYRKYI